MRLRPVIVAALIAGGVVLSSRSAAAPDPLAPYLWKRRVVLLLADPNDPALAEQQRLLSAARRELAERDMVALAPEGAAAEMLRRRFAPGSVAFTLVLIGKDGGAKYTAQAPVPLSALFETVDAMPMRQDEMRQRRSR